MKVLQVINSLATGGAEKLLLESIPKFNNAGVHMELLVLNGTDYNFMKELKATHCCTIHHLGLGSVYNPLHIVKIIPFLRKFDIIHVHLFPCLYWVAIAKLISFSSTPMVYTEHSTINRRRDIPLFKILDKLMYGTYKKIIPISTEVKLLLKKHINFDNARFTKIPNGVDIKKYSQAQPIQKAQLTLQNDSKIILQIARFSKEKDQETLIRAIPYIKEPITILFVGEGVNLDKAKELARTMEVDDKIRFLGIRADVPQILKASDIFVLASNHEGLSLSVLEAMASGLPVVGSNVPGLKNLVYGAGVLYHHKDELDLANKINRLISDQKHYQIVAEKCRARVTQYGLFKMIETHIQLYSELCRNQN